MNRQASQSTRQRRQYDIGVEPGSAIRYRVAVLHDGFVPIYRQPFFERLHEVSDHEYVIFHGQPIRGSGHRENNGPFDFPNVHSQNLEIRLGKQVLVYEPVVRQVMSGGYDAVVVGHQFKFVAAMLLFGLFKLRRKPALLWGHGFHRPRDTGAARWLSHRVARIADGYLAYTSSGADHLVRHGIDRERITVLRNTIDMEQQKAAFQAALALDPEALKVELGFAPSTPVLLFIGRLSPHKRIQELLTIVERLDADPTVGPVGLAVVGDGPLRPMVEARAATMPNVRVLGPIDDFAVARLMRMCEATVIPGTVGLAANHSFAQGLPVITRAHGDQSPEIEYVSDGHNGLIVEGDLDAFVDSIRSYLRDPDLRRRLGEGARATAPNLDLGHSAREFDQGVVRTIQRVSDRDRGHGAA